MNQNSVIDSATRFNKNKVRQCCKECGPDFACQEEYKVNPDKLPTLIVVDCYLYLEEDI